MDSSCQDSTVHVSREFLEYSRKKNLDWLRILWLRSEDDLIDYIMKNRAVLITNYPDIKFLCVCLMEKPCVCCNELEQMDVRGSNSQMLDRILKNMYVRGCPHVVELLKDENKKVDNSYLSTFLSHDEESLDESEVLVRSRLQRYLTDLYEPRSFYAKSRWHNPAERRMLANCGTSLQHMAIGLRKFLAVKTLINLSFRSSDNYDEPLCKPYNVYLSAEAKTTFLWISVYHMALKFHFEEIFTLRLKRDYCKETFCGSEGSKLWRGIVTNYAVEKDNIDILQKLLAISKIQTSKMPWVTPNLMSYALAYAFHKLNKRIIQYLVKEGAVFMELKNEYLPDDMVQLTDDDVISYDIMSHCSCTDLAVQSVAEKGDIELFNLMINCKGFEKFITNALEYCVIHNQTFKVKLLMEKFKRHWLILQRKKEKSTFFQRIFRNVVFNKNEKMLEILIKYHMKENYNKDDLVNVYTAKDWARISRFKLGYDLLHRHNFPSVTKGVTKADPLLEIMLYKKKLTVDISPQVGQLAKCGLNVNGQDKEGRTPLFAAIKNKDFKSMHVLLMHNSDPFQGKCAFSSFMSEMLLKEVFYCNVSTMDHLVEMLSSILSYFVTSDTRDAFVTFVLNSVNALSNTDRERLRNTLPNSAYVKYRSQFEEFLANVPSLFVLSRNAIRRHCPGKHIHQLVENIHLPSTFVPILLLKPEFDTIGGYESPWKTEYKN
ncbi:hypothetical protein FSP39_011645 [Pinctada imbricata]|uniref:Uncharacterized protein n=1 Tax=Pinctada imbricata TaxID=66713 RepID=A0AA88YA33_PINIB|nr:hypothetical protein FSP39_011645 [Pinctada imbricata]